MKPLPNDLWTVTLLYPIKFLKTSVSCTVVGCNVIAGHTQFDKGFVKTAVNVQNYRIYTVYQVAQMCLFCMEVTSWNQRSGINVPD